MPAPLPPPARDARDGPRRRLFGLATGLAASFLAGCSTPAETAPPPSGAAAAARPADPLDVETTRDGRTVLEALWALEKAVRERDARIATLEAELNRLRSERTAPPHR